jgi:hypothetical protein
MRALRGPVDLTTVTFDGRSHSQWPSLALALHEWRGAATWRDVPLRSTLVHFPHANQTGRVVVGEGSTGLLSCTHRGYGRVETLANERCWGAVEQRTG